MDRDFVSSVPSESVNFHFPVHKAAVTVSALLTSRVPFTEHNARHHPRIRH